MSKNKSLNSNHHHIEAGQGHPVVLLHGIASSSETWRSFLPFLAGHGHHAYALDLLGHGHSQQPEAPEDYHIDAYYRHFLAWLGQVGLADQSFSLISHSMGAYLSLRLAHEQPGRVRRLVLLDPFYKPAQLSWRLKASAHRPQFSALVMRATPDWLSAAFLRLNPTADKGLPAGALQQIADDFARVHPNIVYTAPSTRDLSENLSEIAAKTLVIWGEDDPTLDPDSFAPLVEKLLAARGLPLAGTGHMPHLSRAEQVQNEVLAFLNGG